MGLICLIIRVLRFVFLLDWFNGKLLLLLIMKYLYAEMLYFFAIFKFGTVFV